MNVVHNQTQMQYDRAECVCSPELTEDTIMEKDDLTEFTTNSSGIFSLNEFEWISYNSVIPFSSPEQKLHLTFFEKDTKLFVYDILLHLFFDT